MARGCPHRQFLTYKKNQKDVDMDSLVVEVARLKRDTRPLVENIFKTVLITRSQDGSTNETAERLKSPRLWSRPSITQFLTKNICYSHNFADVSCVHLTS